jgi:hypothetical protein
MAALRIKIRLNNMRAEAKLLRFNEGIEFPVLVKMIATKLGVAAPKQYNATYTDNYKLYLGDEALVEDTGEIDNLDELVLKVLNNQVKQEVKRETKVEEEVFNIIDDGSEGEKEAKENKGERVVDGYAFEDMRVAKYFEVEGQQELAFYFGRVATFCPASGDDDRDLWEIQYDDGDYEHVGLEELEICLDQAKENTNLDAAATKSNDDTDDDDDSDDSSIEDVTDQVMSDRQKQKAGQKPIDISGGESDEDYEREADNEDYESQADDLSYADDDDFGSDKKRKAKASTSKRGKRVYKQKDPPLEVLMNNKDVPAAPGKRVGDQDGTRPEPDEQDRLQESSTLFGSPGADQAVKDRIIKLLNTGFHASSNENEAKNAMKLAQRLMRKHNLSQAMLLKERDANGGGVDNEVLKGGLVEVKIVNRKTRKPSQFARWLASLVHPIAKNFDVESYYSVTRGYECSVTFYGIYTNCQLAGYAFRVAAERISQMAAEHKPTKHAWRTIATKSARLSYALGIVSGIDDEVDATIQREKEKRERKLEGARQAVSKGEAYEESDDDDDDDGDDDTDGPGFSFASPSPTSAAGNNDNDNDNEAREDHEIDDEKAAAAFPDQNEHSTPTAAAAASLSGEVLDNRLREMEDDEQNALVLVNHRQKVAKEVLEEHNIKVKKAAKRKPITFDWTSYNKGVEDSKEIDINQRAIRDEVKVKKEKGEARNDPTTSYS